TLIGRDEVGTYYAAQTLSQLITSIKGEKILPSVEIIDFPDVAFRGSVEGFYGQPWSHEARISQMRFYGKYKINTYIYGPKNDPFHGFSKRWRDPYPADKAEKMKELVRVSKENKVNFVWAIHPGKDIKWTDKDGDGKIDDFVHCINKLEMMYQMGVRSYAVFFDDIGGVGRRADMQVKILNYLNREFVRKKGDVTPLILCPSQYNQFRSGGDYLDILGTKLDKDISIMWTGKRTCADISRESVDWINKRISRKAFIWWNWPVTDYVRTPILLGRTYGLDKKNKGELSGLVSNPMDKPEASKIALFGVGDYTWNIDGFNSEKSWKDGIKRLFPELAEEMQSFANHNSDQGPNAHNFRHEESVEIKPVVDAALKQLSNASLIDSATAEKLAAEFKTISSSAKTLQQKLPQINPALLEEVQPWVEAFADLGQSGTAAVELVSNKMSVQEKFKTLNIIAAAIHKTETIGIRRKLAGKRLVYGSVFKTGARVMTPFVKQVYTKMTAEAYEEFTGKKPAPYASAADLYKAFSNAKGLEYISYERSRWGVNVKPLFEIKTLKPGQFIGLKIPSGIMPSNVELDLDNPKLGELGELQCSSDGKTWQKIGFRKSKKSNKIWVRLKFRDKKRYMRYINTSKQNIEFKLNRFNISVGSSRANSFEAMFDGDFTSHYSPVKSADFIIENKDKPQATQEAIIGTVDLISVVYAGGKTVPYVKSHTIKNKKIIALKVKASASVRISEIIWK
ncbi:MAG: beta-N-acetylglucosaminidase domain-containing protein, partial [Lentisphaeraceae bacterium]|nr:beta-N-acetylglucosaminidase domain-containing protein [Lentisphaeraceae bacterium]